jgi:hypothetical protein
LTEAISSRALPPDALAHALLNRGLAFQSLNRHQEAVDDYTVALRIDALSARLRAVGLYNRGLSQQKLGEPARAIDDFTTALFLDNQFAEAYFSRANALRQSGQYLFALADYERAVRYRHPQIFLPYYGQALAYQSLKRQEEAETAVRLALAANPQFAAAKELLARLTGEAPAPAEGSKRVLNLAAGEEFARAGASADDIVTGSLKPQGPDLVVRKTALPEPMRPPANLLPERAKEEAAKTVFLDAANKVAEKDTAAKDVAEKQPVEEAAAKAEDKTAVPEGWTVQLSSQRDEEAAWSAWKRLTAKHGKLLAGAEALVYKADLGNQGVYYRLRVHRLDSRKAAQALCTRLKSAGTSCFVSRAEG